MRRLDTVRVAGAPSAFTTVLTAPAGHKFEVVDVFAGGDLVHAFTWYLFASPGGVLTVHDEINVAASRSVEHRSYNAIVLEPGDALQVFMVVTPSVASTFVATYVDVSPV